MFVAFELPLFLAWLAVANLLPGVLLSFSIFRKEELSKLEKLFIGFTLGIVLMPLVPFLLYMILGVKFSYEVVLGSVAFLYLVAIAAAVISRAYEDLALPAEGRIITLPENPAAYLRAYGIPAVLLLIVLVSYIIRLSSYSSIFHELDPYFYTDVAQQLLTMGHNPFDDQTAWYPEVVVSHRLIPVISYLEASWYTLYSGGAAYDNMLLAVIASMYPPLAAALAIFFIYLLVSAVAGKEWGVLSAGLAAFEPMFIYKLAAGEQEIQPYAFFALMFFFAMYALSLKRGGLKFPIMAGIAFAAVTLGSASQILAVTAIAMFTILQSVLFFIRDKDLSGLKELLRVNAIVLLIGPLLGSALLKDVFAIGTPSLATIGIVFISVIFTGLLYMLKNFLPDRSASYAVLALIIVAGLVAYAFTPFGDYIRAVGRPFFEFAKFNTPLDRTIAEQNLAGNDFSSQIGFMAQSYSIPNRLDSATSVFNMAAYLFLLPFSLIANALLSIMVSLANIFMGTDVQFAAKSTSFLLFWLVFFLAALAISAWKAFKKEDDALFLLFLAIIMLPLLVGLIKAKYAIYAGVLLAVAVGFTFGRASDLMKGNAEGRARSYLPILAVGAVLLLFQFLHMGLAPSLLWGSFQTLYRNDPIALQAKFQHICSATNDSEVCAAAADPMGYASQGTNYQYNSKLCMLSVYTDYTFLPNPGAAPSWEVQSAYFRCTRITEYWMNSMEWIKQNTPPGSRIVSWWDYGHWINFFGQRNAVIRNEHASHNMIGAVAHGYTDASPEELKAWMKAHDVRYALFDMELIGGGGQLGGKYGALNYLSCARDNKTNVTYSPGESQCEADHLWETVFVSSNPCIVSTLTNKTGLTAYKMYVGQIYLASYPDFCINPQDPNIIAYCRDYVRAVPVYCVAETVLVDGSPAVATYYLNETYQNGDLKISKGLLLMPYQLQTTMHMGPVTGATLFYTEDAIWLENGEIKSGYGDRKGKFYDSAIYRALFLNNLPGFKQVYSTPDGMVKIYEIEE